MLGKSDATIADKTVGAVARRIGMSESAVRRTLGQLADEGLVRREVDATTGTEFWIDETMWHLAQWRNGRMIRLSSHDSEAEALEAAEGWE